MKQSLLTLLKYFFKSIRTSFLVSQFGSVSQCYQYPTCGDYTWDQIEHHGLIIGLVRGLKRSSHCIFIPGVKIHRS